MSLQNTWHLRRVADTGAKACYICYKPSTSVMITPDNKDFFYICPSHLKDRHFCSPIIDTAEEARKKREEAMGREIEAVKREYEEKQARKGKGKKGEEGKGKDESKEGGKKEEEKEEKERDDKIDSIKKSQSGTSTTGAGAGADSKPDDDSTRIFALHKNFYQMRIDRLRNIETARRNRERLRDPSLFPSAPSGL